jgi:RHS repeat-associated protein
MTDGIGTTAYSYFPVTAGGTLGAAQLSSVDGPWSNDTIAYTYDELGRSLSRSINSVAASQTYDALGRVDAVTNALGSFTYSYVNQTPRLSDVAYPNGQTSSYSYYGNAGDRRLQEIHHQTSGSATISKFSYAYDAAGNITTWTQQRDSGGSAVVRAYDFGYDAADQLASATYRTTEAAPTILKRYVYTYDPAGNRTAEQIDDEVRQASYNAMNRLTSQGPGGALFLAGALNEAATVTIAGKPAVVAADNTFSGKAAVPSGTSTVEIAAKDYAGNLRTSTYEVTQSASARTFTYDANGNTTGDGTRTFEWDAENRLLAIEEGTHRSEFTYDGQSRRVRIVEKDNGSTTSDVTYLWCGLEICEQRASTGESTTKRFFPQGELQSSTTLFYTLDHLGSIRELIDGSTSVTARYDYDPYGRRIKLAGSSDTVFGFTGHFNHTPTGLMLAPFRVYNSEVGRWKSEDPIGLLGGINLYEYVTANPVLFTDPLGLQRGKGERSRTARPDGTGNPYKGMTPDPKDPTKVLTKDQNGKDVRKAKPEGFQEWWDKKHPKPQPRPPEPDPNKKMEQCKVPPAPPTQIPFCSPSIPHDCILPPRGMPGNPMVPWIPMTVPFPVTTPVPILNPVLVF